MPTITLPLPGPKLHSHNKGHWRAKADAVAEARTHARLMALQSQLANPHRRCTSRATIEYRFYLPDARARDEINLCQACKPYIDGLCDAGLIHKDSWQWLHTVAINCEVDRENPRVELVVEWM